MTNLALTDRDLLSSLAALDALDALACDEAFAAFCDARSDDAREPSHCWTRLNAGARGHRVLPSLCVAG